MDRRTSATVILAAALLCVALPASRAAALSSHIQYTRDRPAVA